MMFEKNKVVNITTLIGKTCKINGDISTKESIRIDGIVKGNVDSENVASVTDTATVEGNIRASEIFIAGKVIGNITATKSLELEKSTIITGDIYTAKLQIHSGAIFNGHTKMGEASKIYQDEKKPTT